MEVVVLGVGLILFFQLFFDKIFFFLFQNHNFWWSWLDHSYPVQYYFSLGSQTGLSRSCWYLQIQENASQVVKSCKKELKNNETLLYICNNWVNFICFLWPIWILSTILFSLLNLLNSFFFLYSSMHALLSSSLFCLFHNRK